MDRLAVRLRPEEVFGGLVPSDSRGLSCDVLATLASPSLIHTERSYSGFSVTHSWHRLTANSCPLSDWWHHLHRRSICMHVGMWQHCDTHTHTHTHTSPAGACTRTKWLRKWDDDGQTGGCERQSRWGRSFPLSLSQWSDNSVQVCDLIRLPACYSPPRPVERWRDSPLIQDAQFSGPK